MDTVNLSESSQSNQVILLSYSILDSLEENIKSKFRHLEKISIKLIKTINHRLYNETCINNALLPTYTNKNICINSIFFVHLENMNSQHVASNVRITRPQNIVYSPEVSTRHFDTAIFFLCLASYFSLLINF